VFSKSAGFYDAIYSWKDYGAEVVRLEALVEARRRSGGRTLLDVACGTGKHLHLLRDRWEVEGVDLDPAMVDLARARLPGVRIEVGDMASFDMGRGYDVVVCLFSAIGYVLTVERLDATIACMARHLLHGGVLAVEPWLTPESIEPDRVGALLAEGEDFKVARMNVMVVEGTVSVADFHYLLGRPQGVEHFTERHQLGLFTHEQYLQAFRQAGLEPELDERGLMGRGLYLAVKDQPGGPTQ
jgi:SAM-dependent methyltransferase